MADRVALSSAQPLVFVYAIGALEIAATDADACGFLDSYVTG